MENQVHTPLRHIGYHKSSKSQLNIFSSSPDIKRPTIVETPVRVNNNKLIGVVDSMVSFLEERNRVDTVEDGFKLNESNNVISMMKENERLKKKNMKLKENIVKMQNNIMTSNLTGENMYTNQSNQSYQMLTSANRELKRKNMKLKEKLKELEYIMMNSTN